MKSPSLIYTIDPENPFYPTVARHLASLAETEAIPLEDMVIFLPAQRARKSLEAAFLQLSDGKALLLPRVITLGDIVEESEALPPPLGPEKPLSVISQTSRQAALMGLIRDRATRFFPTPPTLAQCWQLAKSLGALVDDFQASDIGVKDIARILPDQYAQHWQQALALMTLIIEDWPAKRAHLGALDKEQARSLTLDRMVRYFQKAGYGENRLFIAGTTGSRPSVRRFVARMVGSVGATVFLPGLDTEIPEANLHLLGPDHPQWLLNQLLEELGISPGDCIPLGDQPALTRVSLFRDALAPVEATAGWHGQAYRHMGEEDIFQNCRLLQAPGRRQEAAAIALALREVLETPHRTGLLVTPDRALAAQVRYHLRRWGIDIDDAGGQALKASVQGRFLTALIQFMVEDFSAVTLLTLLLNPLTRLNRPRTEVRRLARLLDKFILRGPRFSGDRSALIARAKNKLSPHDFKAVAALLDDLWALRSGFESQGIEGQGIESLGDAAIKADIKTWLAYHIEAAEKIVEPDPGDTEAPGDDDSLSMGPAGSQLKTLFQDFMAGLTAPMATDGPSYAALFEELLASSTLRKPVWGNRRIAIVGPMEIRNESADLVILGGLNEGSWPDVLDVDPWLNQAMRHTLNLTPLEQRTGQAAHDFITAAAAPEVLLTRAEKVDGSPTVAARWLYRIAALACKEIPRADDLLAMVDAMDTTRGPSKPVIEKAQHWSLPPAPKPALSARPTKLSVSDIQRWMRDPYSLYARKILTLKPLDPLDADPGAADKGILLHEALETFLAEEGDRTGEAGLKRLLAHGQKAFEAYRGQLAVEAFWWPRFQSLARAFVDLGDRWFKTHRLLAVEVDGAYSLPDLNFKVAARADRIDRDDAGNLVIIDYKTGKIPTPRQLLAGYAPQLPLEGLIAEKGGFKGIGPSPVSSLSFWLTKGGKDPLELSPIEKKKDCDITELISAAEAGLIKLVTRFSDPATPYLSHPRPEAFEAGDYDHLARVKEWRGLSLKKDQS